MLCFLATAGADNPDTNSNNIIFIIKYKQNIMSLPSFYQGKTTKNYQNFLSVYCNESKIKSKYKNTTCKYR